jgi:putative two-component system response regulator
MSSNDFHEYDRQPRIMVVDDDNLVLTSIGNYVKDRGYTVDLAGSAAEALDYLKNNPYDLILTDIIMPDMDGIELLKEIRRIIQDQIVIMITSHTGVEVAIEAIRLGAYDYVLKPLDDQDMMRCIDRGLEKARLKLFEKEHQRILEAKVIEQGERIRLIFSEAIEALVNAIEARDSYTQGHSLRVTQNAHLLAEKIQLPAEMAQEINLAAKLHDIGKLGMSDAILNKTSELNDDEYELIKAHPDVGYNILKPMLAEQPLSAIRHHHETWDGTGYPSGLAGRDIPLGARIIALADTYDAMTSNRAYRPAISQEQALSEIESCAGKSLDPELIPLFISVIKEAG